MSINATVDGRTYSGITRITTGGKTVTLSESGGSGGSGPFTLVSTQTYTHSEDWSSTGKVGEFAARYCNVEDTTDSYLYIVKINNTFSGNNAAQELKIMRRVGEASSYQSPPVTNLIWLRASRNNEVTPHWGAVTNDLTADRVEEADYASGPHSLSFFVGAGSTVTVKKYSVNYDWEG